MRFSVQQVEFFERQVHLRMPFRFGVVTLTEAPQAFARVKISLQGRAAEGAAADLGHWDRVALEREPVAP